MPRSRCKYTHFINIMQIFYTLFAHKGWSSVGRGCAVEGGLSCPCVVGEPPAVRRAERGTSEQRARRERGTSERLPTARDLRPPPAFLAPLFSLKLRAVPCSSPPCSPFPAVPPCSLQPFFTFINRPFFARL